MTTLTPSRAFSGAAIGKVSLTRRAFARSGSPPELSPSPRSTSPFLKWAGGKTKLMAQLGPLMPRAVHRMRHVEPFVGGGGFFFSRLPQRALIQDVNASLVETYLAVRDEVENVIDVLDGLSLAHAAGGAYYSVRERYNARDPRVSRAERAAMFIYLNKTCFNGLHRVNRKGEFNVPEGRYHSPKIVDHVGIRLASPRCARPTSAARASSRCSSARGPETSSTSIRPTCRSTTPRASRRIRTTASRCATRSACATWSSSSVGGAARSC